MNRQRKVLITITYNEMGIIIDTKAEEVAQPDLQPTCNNLATDCISRQDAIDAIEARQTEQWIDSDVDFNNGLESAICEIKALPSAQPEVRTQMSSADCISRQDAIDAFDGVKVDEENCTEYDIGYNDGIDFAVSRLSVLPPVQPEIIRCKDCKHWGKRGLCEKWDYYINNEDFYCGCAERRTDE